MVVLSEMGTQDSKDFDWYYQLADTYIKLDHPDLAEPISIKALSVATTQEQKNQAVVQRFFVYLRENKIEEARALQAEIFTDYKPADPVLYTQSALELLPCDKPDSTKDLFNSAKSSMTGVTNSDLFYKLARIFDEKADSVSADKTKYGAWLDWELMAYRQAMSLSAMPYDRLGLSAVLDEKGNYEDMTHELSQIAPYDGLARYLLAKVKAGGTSAAFDKNRPYALSLTKIQLAVKGVTCDCKRGVVSQALRQVRGVIFAACSSGPRYTATVLLDQSINPLKDAKDDLLKATPKSFKLISYDLTSTKPVTTVGEALQIEVRSLPVRYLEIDTSFKQLAPVSPLSLMAEKRKGKTQARSKPQLSVSK